MDVDADNDSLDDFELDKLAAPVDNVNGVTHRVGSLLHNNALNMHLVAHARAHSHAMNDEDYGNDVEEVVRHDKDCDVEEDTQLMVLVLLHL